MNSIYIIDSYKQWRTVGYALDIRCLPDDKFKGNERKLDVVNFDGNEVGSFKEPTSHAEIQDITKIPKVDTLLISKP